MKDLISEYRKIKPRIKKRIAEFRRLHKVTKESIFSELCFCILTANANALKCNEAMKDLQTKKLLLKGSSCQIKPALKGRVRFHNKKAEYIIRARKLLGCSRGVDIKSRLNPCDVVGTRQWLVENIKGFSYKEASHFLRNIGLGKDIAILDRHILKNLKRYGVINKIPVSLENRNVYIAIEDKMRKFAKRVSIPLEDLDLLFWAIETGFVFK